ncbi:MAG: FtsX-like permease family protein [Bacteroidota bacterium]
MADQQQDFAGIFFANEYRELAGQRRQVIQRLTWLFLLTFLALGFAIGGKAQLKKRMDSPFTNWVDVYVTPKVEDRLPDMEGYLDTADVATLYGLEADGKTEWNRYFAGMLKREHDPTQPLAQAPVLQPLGRTIDFEGDLFAEIIRKDSKNLLYRNEDAFDGDGYPDPCGVVVTIELLKKLGYQSREIATLKSLPFVVSLMDSIIGTEEMNWVEYVTFVPLIGVTEQLPSQSDFVSSNRLYRLTQSEKNEGLVNRSSNAAVFLLSTAAGQRPVLKEQLTALFGDRRFGRMQETTVAVTETEQYYGYYLNFDNLRPAEVEQWRLQLRAEGKFQDYAELACSEDGDELSYQHNLTFRFNDLKGIRPFYEDMKEKFSVELSMEQVESRENFRLVARLTSLLGSILAIFGLISILLYLWNLVRGHINKIKPHLGTLKAMGLPNGRLLAVYNRVILKLLAMAILFGLPLALLLGLGLDYGLLKVGFDLVDWTILGALLIIIGVVTLLIRRNLNTVLSATPGDLIYERE